MRKNILLRKLIEALFVDEEAGALKDEDLALVLICLINDLPSRFTNEDFKSIREEEPIGSDRSNIANHYASISLNFSKFSRSSKNKQFICMPFEFIPVLIDKVFRHRRPDVTEKLLDLYKNEDWGTNWETEFEEIELAAEKMASWISRKDDYDNTDDYIDGYDMMLNNSRDVERLASLMRAGPHLVKFLSTSNDEQMIDGIIRLIFNGPDDTIQAGELVKSLGV